ncbi:MAG: VCBS repeat-containing protein [Fidelibacterota bacterium]|nr:MAG: VCBS repeat-containing protein [Candidatus Neomarinimicrobiota bacterium]
MNSLGTRLNIISATILLTSFLSAEITVKQVINGNQTVRILEGGWDYNGNNQLEVLALHEPVDSLTPSELAYYELNNHDTLTALWRYPLGIETLSVFVDAAVTDLDGDQQPELVALLLFQTLEEESDPSWLWVFKWDAETNIFATEPTAKWNHRGRGISYLRPRQLAVADLDLNGDDELIIATGSPDRMVLIANWEPDGMHVLKEFRARHIARGPWPFSLALVDFNGDMRTDILAVGHGKPQALPAYLNSREGYSAVSVPIDITEAILPEVVATADLNGDGEEEVILAHADGSLTLVSMAGPGISATVLDTEIPDLVYIATTDLDGDGATEMIFLQANGTVTTTDTRFLEAITSEQTLSRLPAHATPPIRYYSFAVLPAQVDRPSLIILPVHTATGSFIVYTEIGEPQPPQVIPPPGITPTGIPSGEVIAEETVPSAEAEPLMIHEEDREVYFPDRTLAHDPRALPAHRSPDFLLYPGDEFAYDVLGERIERFAGFRFLRKAPDMVFNYQRQAVVWQPTIEHLGAWHVEYEITYDIGVRPEAMVTDSVLMPDREVVRNQILLYVNDKPRITSEPGTSQLLAGHLFAYRIQVEDRNSDARIDYRLESGPKGMTIERNGILSWRTDETHHDDYQVVISVSDGFDKDVQSFPLNVNAQLTITSTASHVAHVQKLYQYQVDFFQPGSKRDHVFSLLKAPEGMSINQSGLISWTPTPAQIDTQQFHVHITDGTAEDDQSSWIYVNAQPKLIKVPPRAVAFLAGDTLRLAFEGRDPNPGQALNWGLTSGPVNMTIDSVGNLIWPTTFQDLDATQYTVELNDGIDRTLFRGIAFVNSPISITSLPLDSAVVGQAYRYAVGIRDDNRSSLLKLRRPTVVTDLDRTLAYQVELQDDKFKRDLPRYLEQFRDLKNIFINKPRRPQPGEVAEAARIDLKQHVKHIFVDEDRLMLVIHSPKQGLVELEDVLWEFFQGGKGIMPQYAAERIPFIHYSLREFPDGMTVDDDGIITWTPTPVQAGYHQVRLSVSDGYTRDEQSYQVYANYPPVIISQADTMALVEQRYIYRIQVDDKNADASLTYRLTKHPEGMQVDSKGVVTWIPSVEQINWQEFEVEVSDGHAFDRQATTLFVNMPPRIISQPKPVALNNFEYNYRVVAEDLNRDEIHYRATRLPRYSDFDARTGLFKWRPRELQKGPNDIVFEVTDSHGGVTIHEFQVHVFEDPSRRRFLFTGWPLLLAFVGVIFVLGIAIGG